MLSHKYRLLSLREAVSDVFAAIGSNSSWHAHGRALNFTTWTQSIEECESQFLHEVDNTTTLSPTNIPNVEECKRKASFQKLARLWILGDPGSGTQQQRMVRDAFLNYCARSESRRKTWDATLFLGQVIEKLVCILSQLLVI